MMYEKLKHDLLAWPDFLRRAMWHVLGALVIVLGTLAVGTVGYYRTGEKKLDWIDAFLNASMILSGMGPVDKMKNDTAKMFAALYALFSGVVFVTVTSILVAPWLHRLFHWMHLDEDD
jgi:hypothetical protein